MIKHSFQYVQQYFKDHDCELLDLEYCSATKPMEYICICGNKSKICFNNFKNGQRCAICAGNLRFNFYEVQEYFKDNNCELLEAIYINNRTPMKYVCACGNESKICFANFKIGQRCLVCRYKNSAAKQRPSLESVKQYFKDNNCELLEEDYKNNRTPMRYICFCGNESQITHSAFLRGQRCKKCGNEKSAKKRKLNFDEVKQYYIDQNCELLESSYVNIDYPMKYICSCGEKSKSTFFDFKEGRRCRKCGDKKRSGINHFNWNANRGFVETAAQWRQKNRNLIRHCHEAFQINKSKRCFDLLGYSPFQLGEYIESHPNYKYTISTIAITGDKFSIDHIFPLKAFVDYNINKEEYICVANCLENLQPMPLKENSSKGNKYDHTQFELWLQTKGVIIQNPDPLLNTL